MISVASHYILVPIFAREEELGVNWRRQMQMKNPPVENFIGFLSCAICQLF